MSRRTKRGLFAASCIALLVTPGVLLRLRSGGAQGAGEEPAVPAALPKLFAMTYQEGHELAGFTGRPMLLVFGRGSAREWPQLLWSWESEPRLSMHLQSTFQGIFFDIEKETPVEALSPYLADGGAIVMELSGRLITSVAPELSSEVLERALSDIAPGVNTHGSPAFQRLMTDTSVLDELVKIASDREAAGDKNGAHSVYAEASLIVGLLQRVASTTQAAANASRRALELGINADAAK